MLFHLVLCFLHNKDVFVYVYLIQYPRIVLNLYEKLVLYTNVSNISPSHHLFMKQLFFFTLVSNHKLVSLLTKSKLKRSKVFLENNKNLEYFHRVYIFRSRYRNVSNFFFCVTTTKILRKTLRKVFLLFVQISLPISKLNKFAIQSQSRS